MAWAWRGGWIGPWPGRGPFSFLPPWLRPGWIFGRGACWWLFGPGAWWGYRPFPWMLGYPYYAPYPWYPW